MGALIPLIVSLAPYMAQWVGLGGVMAKAGDLVEAVTGTRDPLAAAAALADPSKAAELQLGLAKISAEAETERRRIEMEELKATLLDKQSARALSGASPMIAKTQVVFGSCLLLMMVALVALLAFRQLPFENRDLFNIVLGALIVEFRGVIGFFFGGSTSGHAANNALAQAFSRVTERPRQAAAVATTGDVSISTTEDLNAASLARSRGGRDEGPSRARSLAP